MPKVKVHKGAAKRLKKQALDSKEKQANKRHILLRCRQNQKGNSEVQLNLLLEMKN